ncbi:ubiquitin carboxyl-terminal hydrolase puf [Condylostylus longicornis]|uniref:ubiquitin carboxyl-terminal hydrolase puf n=1 Tax=Condylostylus longicornis TaxID=2530218 RepID=UPI00244DCABD|nr:ubiquitin carboxyl-terminal hydrolase puf [Condylostylus longicornis]
MCDCNEFLHLLASYEARLTSNDSKHLALLKSEIEIIFGYTQSWPQRQCMCIYRDQKNFERFNLVIQSMICFSVYNLKKLQSKDSNSSDEENRKKEEFCYMKHEEKWILPEVEKLLVLVSKTFLLNFPLYIAYKHGVHSRLDEISTEEAQNLSTFCDLHDNEIPAFLLRNVALFCNSGGFQAMMLCFEQSNLPVTTAHAITATVSNIKLWLNYRCILQLFLPLRSSVLHYMCKLSDQDLRSPATRSMADFVWSAIRDPLDSSINFDVEGLALAYKYFTSSTLTMRLAGMAQINAHINLFNEICTTETVGEVEVVGQKLGDWLTENQIIQHLFGPNLHVEVIKQSHIVLNFLAVENQITEDHINLIWQAAQLKHCSKPVYDILPSLVKNLAPRPAMHLYSLLCRLDPKEHTEQSIYIISALTKLIWSRDGVRSQLDLPTDNLAQNTVVAISSENSVSIDGSNTEEDQQDDDSSSVSHKSHMDLEGNDCSDFGAPPCKQARRKHHGCSNAEEINKAKQHIAEEIANVKAKNSSPIQLKGRRLSNLEENTSSDEDCVQAEDVARKKIRKRRKNNNAHLTRLAHEFVEAIWDAESHSDGEVGIVDSDCSDPSQIQRVLSIHNAPDGPFIRAIADTHLNELLSGGENDESYSSPMSNKSEKNMADFDDDDSPCEEELAQLVSKNHNCLPSFTMPIAIRDNPNGSGSSTSGATGNNITGNSSGATHDESNSDKNRNRNRKNTPTSGAKIEEINAVPANAANTSGISSVTSKEENVPIFKIMDVCKPGNTLLWDLLQDDKIGQLGESLAMEAEKALGALLCFSMNKLLRTKFIEGCLQNLAANRTVIVSLRLLPKLFASFQQFRSSDTHQLTMWAERQHKMMFHFFNNIKFYANSMKNNNEGQVLKENGQPMYSHITQVQVRLQFLTSLFSCLGSPKSFRLSLEQVDALWDWLANDIECADCLFAWLQVQAKGIEQHALGIETLQHLYLKKLPELKPEGISMVALGLFQQLCSLARLAIAHYEKQSGVGADESTASAANIVGMNHLWKIALRAHNTEVSLAAIQYINSFYMGQQLKLEKEFVAQCMDHLIQAAEDLKASDNQDHALMCVQRALMLLNTHLETFRRRYAFHLRRWALEGKGIGSHSNLRNEGSGPPIRIILQPAGLSEKSVLHMHACDLIAELKAEISKWWETLQGGAKTAGVSAPVLGLLLSEGPLRIITQGQELTSEYDERSLGDVGFKDNQIIYVSLGGRGARRKEPLDHPTLQPPPPKECLPTVLLLQPKYLEELFRLMQTLGDMKMQGKCTNFQPHIKAQILSRRIWDILAILPTDPNLLESFKNLHKDLQAVQTIRGEGNMSTDYVDLDSSSCESDDKNPGDRLKQKIAELLDPNNLQKFMYSLYIVETLALKTKQQQGCCGNSAGNNEHSSFKLIQPKIVQRGSNSGSAKTKRTLKKSSSDEAEKSGEDQKKKSSSDDKIDSIEKKENKGCSTLKDSEDESIKDSSINKITQEENKENVNIDLGESSSIEFKEETHSRLRWNEVFIKCGGMQHLFDIFISGLLQNSYHSEDKYNEWRHDCLASLLRIICILGFEELKPDDMLLVIPKPHSFMLEMMEVDGTLKRLASILHDESAHQHSLNQLQLRTGFWGRAQVVQFVMNILVSFVHASKLARELLWSKQEYSGWLQKFILDDPEPAVRREICAGVYRICLGNSKTFPDLLGPLLQKLVSYLPIAEKMTSHCYSGSAAQHIVSAHHEEGKEPYGPACRDYFWLLSRLVDTLSPDMIKECFDDSSHNSLDIERLCCNLTKSILDRDFYETRHGLQDDGLVGLLNLMTNLIKYDPPYKYSQQAQTFIDKIFLFLFDLPSPADRQKPKCKSQASRAAAYDLLVELCKNAPHNYQILHKKLLEQHRPGPHPPYPWDYWPRDDGRSECGYVGLTNLGATCYMASCVQHLYMMPQARRAILSVPPQMAKKHAPTLHELQRMFAYLLESERKSYNPRSFCRVYQMDHQPLNTGEQKDMAEFFIDLVSKLEEMTPELKTLVKKLFSGTQSNNVVSLDCGHVSRTAEEFYTVRCQVADMRNLQESLDEVTVKDTLEGDNMYTCSQCGKKVRAEKRACFKKLPQILCFNTMRYTFNMLTMLKEKVNTHFSFPMRLDMSDYVEKTLMPQQYQEDKRRKRERKLSEKLLKEVEKENTDSKMKSNGIPDESEDDDDEQSGYYEYDLVGITVHTGTADGGHYYSFIKERNETNTIQQQNNPHHQEKWFLFNDAEVKPFDPSQIASECFGGEMTSKTYDSVTEKYLDFSFEKTNSAYMLFYERRISLDRKQSHQNTDFVNCKATTSTAADNQSNSIIDIQHETENNKLTNMQKVNSNLGENVCDIDVSNKSNENKANTTQCGNSNANSILNSNQICGLSSIAVTASTSTSSTSSSCSLSPSTSQQQQQQQKLPLLQSSDRNAVNDPNRITLSKELEDWIWQDNKQFLQDKNIFEHTYFNFMWQICGHIPQTLLMQTDVTCMAAQLSVSFFIETFIHAKEKPTMVLWVELLTKQFNASQEACEWFLTHMSAEPWWPVQVLIQCPNQMVRQMFQRLVIHVIQRLRPSHYTLYLKTDSGDDGKDSIGNHSCTTKFIKSLIHLMEHGAKPHLRHLSEFFGLLYEFSRMGDEEALFLLRINVIRSVADFYLGNKNQDCLDSGSGDDENSSDEALSIDKARPASLDKMIALVASLVERSRGPDFRLHLSPKDYNAIAGGKGFPFLYQQIRDNINPHQTRHLIHALCRWDERLANQIITMLFASVTKHTELCGPFFKLLTLLTETQGGPSGLPCFSQLVLQRVWDAAEYCPQSALDWLAVQAPRNKIIHAWILQSAESWVEQFLMAHNNSRVRNAASFLLVSLVPSQSFRTNYRSHSLHKLVSNAQHRELNSDAQIILHNIINLLLRLLRAARVYTDIGIHGTAKLTAYFTLLTYCMVTKVEKLMLGPYMRALWDLFHPRLSEPSVPAHHNKHALLAFWHHAITDCPENAQIVANCPEITRNIAFNYILADHDDSEIVAYNRAMLPAYYGLLRLCCQQSRALTRQLAAHQNLQWAFKNITPHPTQYSAAVDELFRLMTLFAARHPDSSEQEQHEINSFRRTTLSAYLSSLDGRVSWGTLISALRILVDNDEDRLFVVYNGGIEMCFDALHTLHSMYHEATACHVAGDLQELLTELLLLVSALRLSCRMSDAKTKMPQQQPQQPKNSQLQNSQQPQQQASTQSASANSAVSLAASASLTPNIKGLPEAVKRLATFLNTYNPPEIRNLTLDVLKEMVRNPSLDVTSILAPIFTHCHYSAQNSPNSIGPLGPYFPRRGAKTPWPTVSKNTPRPPRPMVQMSIPQNQIIQKGIDKEYDCHLEAFYRPYHDFLDVMMRMAVNTNQLNELLVKLSCLAAIEAAPLHFNLFPKFWVGIFSNKSTNKYVELLVNTPVLVEYVDILLRDERVSLNDPIIRNFLEIYYPKVESVTTRLAISRLLYAISYTLHTKDDLDDLCGDLYAIRIIAQATGIPLSVRKQLRTALKVALVKNQVEIYDRAEELIPPKKKVKMSPVESSSSSNAGAKIEQKADGEPESTVSEGKTSGQLSSAKKNDKADNKANEDNMITSSPNDKSSKLNLENSTESKHNNNADSPISPIEDQHSSPSVSEDVLKQTLSNKEEENTSAARTSTPPAPNSVTNKSKINDKYIEELEKEKCYLKTIESFIKAILELLQDEDDEDSSQPSSSSSSSGSHNSFSAQASPSLRASNSPIISVTSATGAAPSTPVEE